MKLNRCLFSIILFFVSNQIEAQQTVFYNWLRYHQQKILPTYESRDYWAGYGFLETSSSYILPYQTSDYVYGEGGFFVLKKNGDLDSVMLWDIYRPHTIFNNQWDIVKLNSNLYALSRSIKDTSVAKYTILEYTFVDSKFKVIRKVSFSNDALSIPHGIYVDYDNKAIIAKQLNYKRDNTGNVTYAEGVLYRIDTSGIVTKLFSNKGLGNNYIREFALDPLDSTYIFLTQNDSNTTYSLNNKDTFEFYKIKKNGAIVWKYQWHPYSILKSIDEIKPNFVIDSNGFKFIISYSNGNDSSSILFYHLNRKGTKLAILKEYKGYEKRDGYETIHPYRNGLLAIGSSTGLLKDTAWDTQQNKFVSDFGYHISKIDTNGNVLWRRRHNVNNPNIRYMRDWRRLTYAQKVSDGGYILLGYAFGVFKNLPPNQLNNYLIVIKTDSCGYSARDTCKLAPRIDSIRYRTAYLSLDELNYNVCGRRWSVDGKVFTTEKLTYSFSDTGTYTIGIWGFAGATTDSTTIQVRITQLDSCFSKRTDTCRMRGIVNEQVCEKLKFSIDTSQSQYCTRYWKIENSVYYQDTVSYTFSSKNSYAVYLIGKRGITIDTSKLIVKVDCMSSILNSEGNAFNIYPNPARDYIFISFPTGSVQYPTIKLYNLLGQEMQITYRKESSDKLRIDIAELPNGIYILKLIHPYGEEIYRTKIEVQK